MKKIFSLILSITVITVLCSWLVSCGEDPVTDNTSNQPNNGSSDVGDNGSVQGAETWNGGWACFRGDPSIPLDYLSERFFKETSVSFATEQNSESDRLFIVGEYDNDLSRKAYSVLYKNFGYEEGTTVFAIYSDGTSVAIAYHDKVALNAALDYFFTEFYDLPLSKSGPVIIKKFDVVEYVNQKREAERNESFEALENRLSEGAIQELKKLYSLYNEDIYVWLANLWDPDIGGFYYSNSARNTDGFLPDLESTAQALLFMSNSGMFEDYNGKYKDALPPEMIESIVSFAKELQSSSDGYFYHPQWGRSISRTRLGRDLSWGTRILATFGESPYWNTPNGVAGQYGEPGDTDIELTTSLCMSGAAVAVSKVVPTSSDGYLASVEAFLAHLEKDYDWENNSYAAGNALESDLGQIQNKGSAYTDALIDFLNRKQKSNGLWEDEISYDSVNGLMKISVVYTSLKKEIPNVEKSLACAIQMLKSTEEPEHVCSVYNPWEAVANILVSIEKISGKSRINELQAQFRAEAEELIRVTLDKLVVFAKQGGGFSYYVKYSAPNSQGSPVALALSEESDVNATMICVNSIITSIFDVFGLNEVARYYSADFAYMSDILNELGTIIKDDIPPAQTSTFDDFDINSGEEVNGVVTYPTHDSYNVVGDDDVINGGTYKWFQSSVVQNPDPEAKKGDLVLYSKTNVAVGEEKSLADKPSSTRFNIPNAQFNSLGDCYVYDADMYFVSGYGKTSHTGATTSEPILQLFFMTDALTCAGMNFVVYTDENGVDYVKIGEAYAGLDGKDSNVAGKIPMDTWVNIRFEFYKNYVLSEDGKTSVYKPILKVYVNGEYQGECDANVTGTDSSGSVVYYDRKISLVSISYYRFLASEVYFNNVFVERCNLKYTPETNPDAIVDIPLPDEEMRESYGFEEGLLNTSNVANKVRVYHFGVAKYINAFEGQTHNPSISYSIVSDPANAANHVLKVVATTSDFDKPSRTEVYLYNSGADGDDHVFSGRFYYSSADIAKNGDLTQMFIMTSTDSQAYSLRINAKRTNGVWALSLISNNGTATTVAEGIECDKWFTLKIVFHATKVADSTGADIYLNDTFVYKDSTYKSAALEQAPLVKVAIVHQKTNRSTLYLDDLSYKKSGEVFEAVESNEPVASFTDGFDTKYLHSFSFNGDEELSVVDIDVLKMSSLYTQYSLYQDPKEASNQVLRAVNKNGGSKAGYTRVDISNASPEGNCYTFETKMYAEVYKAGYNLSCISFVDKDGKNAFSVYVSVDSATSKMKIASTGNNSYPAKGTNLLDGSDVSVAPKSWFTLRMEFYHMGADSDKTNTYLKLYVNDTIAYSGVAYCNFGFEIDYVKIEHCKTNQSSAVLYDDVSFTRTNEKYTKNDN